MPMTLSSRSFQPQAPIPPAHTCEGADLSPELAWTDPPAGTKSFALIVNDPDAPSRNWVHWVLYNLPVATRGLPENVPKTGSLPDQSRQGMNDFRRLGYGGPCPPSGPAHRYVFTLYAVDRLIELEPGRTKAQLERAIEGHILARAQLIGTYQR